MAYHPPYTLNNAMTKRVASIAELIGRWKANNPDDLLPALRRSNRIRTIQASLAVEQNTLSVEQVTAVIEGKTVLGAPHEIQEVLNAFKAYEAMATWQPHRLKDLCSAHGLLLHGLLEDAGRLRSGGAGIYRGEQLVHMAPPPSQLQRLMHDLLAWLQSTDAHPLIASLTFHYEFEFIHPFSDGNGRMGRLWQTLILSRWQPLLAYLPVETVIEQRQEHYYVLLSEADKQSECSAFIEFLLSAIEASLTEAIATEAKATTQKTTLKTTQNQQTMLAFLRSHPQASRKDIAAAINGITESGVKYNLKKLQAAGLLERVGSARTGHWRVLG